MDTETGVMYPQTMIAKDRQVPEASTEAGDGFSLKASGRNQSCQVLDFTLLASKTEREEISVVLRFPVCARFVTAVLEN